MYHIHDTKCLLCIVFLLHTDIENKSKLSVLKIECITFILYQLSHNKQPSCDLLAVA